MDWPESNLCIKCDKGGNVLLCNENGCPLAVHEGCLGGPARLDDAGRFCCPYCVYKQAVAERRKAREIYLARKKALSMFMDGCEKDNEENKVCGRNQSNVNSEDGKSKSNNGGVIDQQEKVSDAEEDSESCGGSEDEDPSLKMNGGNGDGTVEEKQVREEDREASVEEENIQEEEREASVEKENVQEEERKEENNQEYDFGTPSPSTNEGSSLIGRARAKRGSKRIKLVDKEHEAVSVLQSKFSKHRDKKKQASPSSTPASKSARRPSSAMGTGKVVIRKFNSPRRLSKSEKPSKKSDAPGSGKRRRLMWTEEEEEALREGVNQYPDGENIPWKKILEESDKFDPTRTPADLKDKWRIQRFFV